MATHTSRLIVTVSAFLAALVLCGAVVVLATQRGSLPVGQSVTVGGPFKLVDQDGRTVTEQDMEGRPFLVYFGYTHCPDLCPTTLYEISQVFRSLGPDADKTAALFITVDPERDTPALLKDYLSNFDPHIRGLTGKQGAIDAVVKGYRAYARKVPSSDGDYTMDHTALVYLMDKQGRFVAPFNLKQSPEQAAANLRRYM
jgi:protein SCO1